MYTTLHLYIVSTQNLHDSKLQAEIKASLQESICLAASLKRLTKLTTFKLQITEVSPGGRTSMVDKQEFLDGVLMTAFQHCPSLSKLEVIATNLKVHLQRFASPAFQTLATEIPNGICLLERKHT